MCRKPISGMVEMAIYGTHRPLCAHAGGCSEKTVLHYCKDFQLVYPSEFCTEHTPKKVVNRNSEQKEVDDKYEEQHPTLSQIVKGDKGDQVERYPGRKKCSRCHRKVSAKLLK